MGYRDFAKDYEIEYVERPGHKKPKAVRVYVGPWFRFIEPAEKIRALRWFYLVGVAVIAVALLIPMCIDCDFTRIWYIQVPAAAAWIPWVFAVMATWRLWTAKEKVDREHNAGMGGRMSGASLFLSIFSMISFSGCIYAQLKQPAQLADYVICGCCTLCAIASIALFTRRKQLKMVEITPDKTA